MGKNDPYIEVPVIKAADEVGFIGFNTDPTPDEKYTVQGVTSDPEGTPETNAERRAEVEAYQREGIENLEHSTEIAGVDTQFFTPDRGSREENLASDPSITVPGDDDDNDVAGDTSSDTAYEDYTYAELQAEVKERDLDVNANSSGDTLKAALREDDAA